MGIEKIVGPAKRKTGELFGSLKNRYYDILNKYHLQRYRGELEKIEKDIGYLFPKTPTMTEKKNLY